MDAGQVLVVVAALAALVTLVGGLAAVAVAVAVARRLLVAGLAALAVTAVRGRALRPGSGGEPARLRVALRKEVAALQRALAVASARGWPVGDAPSLVRRVVVAADELDTAIAMVESGPRQGTGTLARLGDDVEQLVAACAALRASLVSSAREVEAPGLQALAADCRAEADALRDR